MSSKRKTKPATKPATKQTTKPAPKLTLIQLKKKAQTLVNKFIRDRDALYKPDGSKYWICISCGREITKVNSGHFAPIVPYDHLRYNEDNIHAQCIYCNQHCQGNSIGYRFNLIKKIGLDKVEQLEHIALHETHKWTTEEIYHIIDVYK
jgi:hypothetical protein